MSSDAQRFARAVLAAFRAAGHYTDDEIGAAGGPSTTTLTKLRKVAETGEDMPAPRSDTLRKIDLAANWAPGSARAVWEDGAAEPAMRQRSAIRETLGLPPLTPEELRIERRRSRHGGLEGYVEMLADRLLEVEERLDLLETDLRGAAKDPEPRVARDYELAADDSGDVDPEAEADTTP